LNLLVMPGIIMLPNERCREQDRLSKRSRQFERDCLDQISTRKDEHTVLEASMRVCDQADEHISTKIYAKSLGLRFVQLICMI
jgi:hypothetical protein